MLTRLLIALLLLVLGAVAFLAIKAAPADWKQRVGMAHPPLAQPPAASAPVIPYEQLWAAPAPAAGARYALLAGQFPAEASARALAAGLQQRGAEVAVLAVKDIDGVLSWVVAVGRYAHSAAAYADAPLQASRFDLVPPLPAVVLPTASAPAL